MLLVNKLILPTSLPHPEAIKSFRDNRHSYDPEFWELEYQSYRYLENVATDALNDRYLSIFRNMKSLVSRDRDIIPIQSFLSSWYWFRKEHQTRLEYHLRGTSPSIQIPQAEIFDFKAQGAPVRPKHPNAGDVLFRYDKKQFLEAIAKEGSIRIRPASDFFPVENDEARQDQELLKRSFLPGRYSKVTAQDGKQLKIIGDIQQDVTFPNYYVFCMACDWDQNLISAFDGSDACLVIRDTDKFFERIQFAGKKSLHGWYFHHNPVNYFDPYERIKNEHIDPAMSKDFKFAYQREYRFLWFSPEGIQPNGFIFLNLGDLQDIAEVHAP